MNDRERLIEILEDTLHEWECDVQPETLSQIAEHLLANGVIVPPCKVGDTVYIIHGLSPTPHIVKCTVEALHITSGKNRLGHRKPSHALLSNALMPRSTSKVYLEEFGKIFFLTREEAEKALKEREDDE